MKSIKSHGPLEPQLLQGQYSGPKGFITDMNLIFTNAKEYNQTRSQVSEGGCGETIRHLLEAYFIILSLSPTCLSPHPLYLCIFPSGIQDGLHVQQQSTGSPRDLLTKPHPLFTLDIKLISLLLLFDRSHVHHVSLLVCFENRQSVIK